MFPQRRHAYDKSYIKRCPISLIIHEMRFTSFRMAVSKKQTSKFWLGWGKTRPCPLFWGKKNRVSTGEMVM
jgi:hypothetical protein